MSMGGAFISDYMRLAQIKAPPPGGFPEIPLYTIPKKWMIGQPQKWRLIDNRSGHRYGKP